MVAMLWIPEDADVGVRVVVHSPGTELHPVVAVGVAVDEAGVVTRVQVVHDTRSQGLWGAGVDEGRSSCGGLVHEVGTVSNTGEKVLGPHLQHWALLQEGVAEQVTLDEPGDTRRNNNETGDNSCVQLLNNTCLSKTG